MVNIDPHCKQLLHRVQMGIDDTAVFTGNVAYTLMKTIVITGLFTDKAVTDVTVEVYVSLGSAGHIQLRTSIDGGAETIIHTFTTAVAAYEYQSATFAAQHGTVVEFRFYLRNVPGGAPPHTFLRATRLHGDEKRPFIYE